LEESEDETDFLYNGCFDPDQNIFRPLKAGLKNCLSYSENQFISLCDSLPAKTFSTFHMDIRSLPKNYDLLTHHLSCLKHEFTVVALSETWLSNDVESLYELPNYTAVHCIRESRRGGGVSLFVHRDSHFNKRDDLKLKTGNKDIESIFVEVTVQK